MNKISPKRPLAAVSLTACLAACLAGVNPAAAAAAAAADSMAASASAGFSGLACGPLAQSCYSPEAYQVAYGVAPLLRRGINGRGQTVVVGPEPAAAPPSPPSTDIRRDLAAFDTKFGLPPATLHVVNMAKSKTPYLTGEEEVTDTEMVHAIAPDATLDVILMPSDITTSPATFAAAITGVIREGVALNAAVVSISAGVGEHFLPPAQADAMNQSLEQARDHHVTVVAASGDTGVLSSVITSPNGPPVQVNMPASDPLVLGVGGTSLDAASPAGTYQGEMAWNATTEASGGGYSSLFTRPAYQNGVPRIGATRGVPDVAANADSDTAMALELSEGKLGDELEGAPGTSASTPLWAGVIALADQEAGRHLGFVNPAIYAIARGPAYHQAFHDVTTGDNSVLWPTGLFTGYTAGPGWDPVTGWGSPDAEYLVPLLARA